MQPPPCLLRTQSFEIARNLRPPPWGGRLSFGLFRDHDNSQTSRANDNAEPRRLGVDPRSSWNSLGLLVSDVQAAASGALAIHHLAAVGRLHPGAEPDGTLTLDTARAVWVMHGRPSGLVAGTAQERSARCATPRLLRLLPRRHPPATEGEKDSGSTLRWRVSGPRSRAEPYTILSKLGVLGPWDASKASGSLGCPALWAGGFATNLYTRLCPGVAGTPGGRDATARQSLSLSEQSGGFERWESLCVTQSAAVAPPAVARAPARRE